MPMTPDDDDLAPADDADLVAPPPQGFSDLVRESPIGAVISAFVIGFLVSRLI